MLSDEPKIIDETPEVIVLQLGRTLMLDEQGFTLMQKDYKVGGDIWQVHKGDADPFPSKPHAHCIDGKAYAKGCSLHLGTSEFFRDRQPTGKRMDKKQFERLIELIRPKFPGVELPIPT